MKISMRLREYREMLNCVANKPACLGVLTEPFGLKWPQDAEPHLLVGHILDALGDEFAADEVIDSLDVATLAWELGCVSAGRFLDEAPDLLYQQVSHLRNASSLN